jgi:hypothetical protein
LIANGREANVLHVVKPSEILVSFVAGLVGALGIDLFGTPGLIVVTVLLILGIVFRVGVAVLACAIACAVVLALWALAMMRCDPTIGDCTPDAPLLVMFGWLALVLVVGVAATLRLVVRSRPR